MKIENAIFIVGVPRSGTTLLYRLLAQHSNLVWFSVEEEKKFLTPEFIKKSDKLEKIKKNILEKQKNLATNQGKDNIPVPAELSFVYDEVFLKNWKVKVSEQYLEILINEITKLIKGDEKKRYLCKTPQNSIRIREINEVFPNSKFLHIVRDPRAVVNSLLERAKKGDSNYFGIPIKKKLGFLMNSVEKHSLQWKQVVEEIIKTSKELEDNQFFQIKYEELTDKTDYCLEKITNFCELPPFDYIYNKEGKVVNLEKKDSNEWGYLNHPTIINRNKTLPNFSQIEKHTIPLSRELGYN